ncbi:MAG: hypothetical protein HQM09_09200 [Candidatus Riflebacteria bacterium]|nr:hypothetical protein [Candidatus Riflebacteria bacterium]
MNMTIAKHIFRCTLLLLGAVLLIGGSTPVLALDEGSAKALEAFKRYEPDFTTSLRRLKDADRKMKTEKLDPGSGKGAELKLDAEETLDYVQKRYDMLDDLQKGVAGDHPADRSEIYQGFQRIDDLYRECRNFYQETFENKEVAPAPKTQKTPTSPAMVASKTAPLSKSVKKEVGGQTKVPAGSVPVQKPAAISSQTSFVSGIPELGAPEPGKEKLRLTGNMRFDIRNRNEMYDATPGVAGYSLPNNYNQLKLVLQYEMDAKNKLTLEDKYAERRRNELMKENAMVFSYLHIRSKKNSFSFKDTLHHVYYPDANQKDYRDNLAEVFWNNKDGKWDRLMNLGLQTRSYQNYSLSDFRQYNLDGQATYFIRDGTLFTEATYNARNYKNSPSLDYTGGIYDFEYNRSYSGNKSEIAVGETWEGRKQGNENRDFYRSNYWDNFFRFRYDLPVSKTFTWLFEDEHQQRRYPGDDLRGYAQLKLKTTAKITIDKNTRGRLSHSYIFNDENTVSKAHTNHIFNGMWERKISNTFKIKIEDTFQRRYGLQETRLSFGENVFTVLPTWKLPNKIELAWKNEYLFRDYFALAAPYADYKYFQTGIQANYARPKKYDWQVEATSRSFSYQPAGAGWTTKSQPLFLAKGNIYIRDGLKLNLSASTEKTFYRYFDTIAQELLWNFNQPYTITEFLGGIEYEF